MHLPRLAKRLYDPIVSGTRCTTSLREGIRPRSASNLRVGVATHFLRLRNVSFRDRQRKLNAWHRLARRLYDPIVSGTRCTASLREGTRPRSASHLRVGAVMHFLRLRNVSCRDRQRESNAWHR